MRDPKNTMAIYNLALAHEHLRQYGEARVWVRRGLRLDPEDVSLQRLDLRIRLLPLRDILLSALKRLIPRRTPRDPKIDVQH